MRGVPLLLAALLVVPTASAFPGGGAVTASLPAGGTGAVLLGGATEASATVVGVAFLGGANLTLTAARVEFVGPAGPVTLSAAEVTVHGADLVALATNATARATYASPGGLGLLVAGLPAVEGVDAAKALAFSAERATTAVRGDGEAFLAFDGGTALVDGAALDASAVRLAGAWSATGEGAVAAFALPEDSALDVRVRPGAPFDLAALMDRVRSLQGDAPEGADAPLPADGLVAAEDALQALAPMLNGAALLVPNGEPLQVAYAGRPDPDPRFAMVRGDVGLREEGGAYRVQSDSAMAFDGRAFATDAPPALGPVPVLAALLWAAAIGTVVWRFAKRPPEEPARSRRYRLVAAGLHVVALAVVLFAWDAAFRSAFGTSALAALAEGRGWVVVLGLAAVELVPWSLAGLLFALPTRIVVSNVLARHGHGKRARGAAKAAGVLVLGLVGPWHALWIVNTFVLPYVPGG